MPKPRRVARAFCDITFKLVQLAAICGIGGAAQRVPAPRVLFAKETIMATTPPPENPPTPEQAPPEFAPPPPDIDVPSPTTTPQPPSTGDA
jgi:hypothetical protein